MEKPDPRIESIRVSEVGIEAEVKYGPTDTRTIVVPLRYYPRLFYADPAEKKNYTLLASGRVVHWPELDEDISVENIVHRDRSKETSSSLRRWMEEHYPGRVRRVDLTQHLS